MESRVKNKIFTFLTILILTIQILFGQNYTWSENISCIVFENCAVCHNEKGIADFSLLSYEDAAPRALLMAEAVRERYMPPWPPDPTINDFLDARVLTQDEIESIIAWAEAGAPSGDLSAVPLPPVFESNEVIQDPDFVVQLPEYISQATTEDDFRCFVIPSEIAEDRFITAIEVVPGNPKIVHHAGIFLDETGIPKLLDENDPSTGYSCFGGIGADFRFLGGWVPGMPPTIFPEGMGMSLPANSYIVVQLHYPAGSQGEVDRTKVNFKLTAQSNLREIQISSWLNHIQGISEPFFIPANTTKSFSSEFFLPIDITILGVGPHMHLVGRTINSYSVSHPTLDTISLVSVPDWDFDWQGFYEYKKPIILLARSTLHVEAKYDNTANNHENPNSPPKDVKDGQESTDEMMIVSFLWTRYRPGDEDLVFEDDSPLENYACEQITVAVDESDPETAQISIFPNPVQQMNPISIQFSSGINLGNKRKYEIFNITGRKVSHGVLSNSKNQNLDLPESLEGGVYFISIFNENNRRVYLEKIFVF